MSYYLDGFSGTFIINCVNTQDLFSVNLNKILTFFFCSVQYTDLSPFNMQVILLLLLLLELLVGSGSIISIVSNLIGDALLVNSFNESWNCCISGLMNRLALLLVSVCKLDAIARLLRESEARNDCNDSLDIKNTLCCTISFASKYNSDSY